MFIFISIHIYNNIKTKKLAEFNLNNQQVQMRKKYKTKLYFIKLC